MRALVIGYGSIGRRHTRVLRELGCHVGIVSRHALAEEPTFSSLRDAVAEIRPDYVVIANETSLHRRTVGELVGAGFRGAVLIEKPLGDGPAVDVGSFSSAAVAYNLRFHPILMSLADELAGQRIVAAEVYCGQYLPDWRPDSDYRSGYSADPARGGGVLRDLSHELDYLLWLCGSWRRAAALGGRFGPLPIESDDCWAVLAELDRCPAATLQINYLDRPGRRRITITTAEHTYVADFGQGALIRDGQPRNFSVDRDDTYRAEHRAMLWGDAARLCSIAHAEQVMRLIEAIERSAETRSWVVA